MASHTVSQDIIWKCFLEFFERQSFIVSFLSKRSAREVEIFGNAKAQQYHAYLKNYVDEIMYYDVSLYSDIHVILSIAHGEKYKAVGLGTGLNLYDAVVKSQQEVLQSFGASFSKHNTINESLTVKDYYHQYFDSLSTVEFLELYSYIDGKKLDMADVKQDKTNDYYIRAVYERLGMEPYIITIPNTRGIASMKICKVFSPNWFPHMNPALYDEDVLSNVETALGIRLERTTNPIPFP